MPVRLAGAGSCHTETALLDLDFSAPSLAAAVSRRAGDGGLEAGSLVLSEELERFAGRPLAEILGGAAAGAERLGGAAAALERAARDSEGRGIRVELFGARGKDERGESLADRLRRPPLDASRLRRGDGPTARTLLLRDRRRGALCAVHEAGASALLDPADLGPAFLDADIAAFCSTSLAPALHDRLQELLPLAASKGALTVVEAAFDPRAQRRDPVGPWPLGTHDDELDDFPGPSDSYHSCDLLVMDEGVALRLAGCSSLAEAVAFFEGSGLGAALVALDSGAVLAWARPGRFAPLGPTELATAGGAGLAGLRASAARASFSGGVLAELASQMKEGRDGSLDLSRAASRSLAGAGSS